MIGKARCGLVSLATRHKTKKGTNDTVRSSGLLMRLLGALCVIIMAMANPTEFRTAMITELGPRRPLGPESETLTAVSLGESTRIVS